MPKSEKQPLFAHIEAFIIPAGISRGQQHLLSASITDRGGIVVKAPSETMTHIITALRSANSIRSALHWVHSDGVLKQCKVVSHLFVAKSIVTGRCMLDEGVIKMDEEKKAHIGVNKMVLDSGVGGLPKSDVIDLDLSDADTEPLSEPDYVSSQIPSSPTLVHASSVQLPTSPLQLPTSPIQLPSSPMLGSESQFEEVQNSDLEDSQPANKTYIPEPLLKYIKGEHLTSTTSQPNEPNKLILDEFNLLVSRAEAEGNQWRIRAYKRAVKLISALDFKISSSADVTHVPGIGKSMREKIDEIIKTGQARKAHTVPEKFQPIDVFKKIYGVGPKVAEKFYAKGFRTLDDVRTNATLTRDQQLGLKYYDDFLERIPRAECNAISDLVVGVVKKIDPMITCQMMGSYLRGSESCGDADFIISHPDGNWHPDLLDQIVAELKACHFIIDSLSSTHFGDPASTTKVKPAGETTFRGVCKLPGGSGIARRLDLLVVPYNELGAATIYFTGNDYFNRCVRLYARKKGYSLSQHGLTTREDGQLVASKTEKEIFDVLGIPWRPPNERNF
ncbi:hypothetical protein BJ741DRAFT_645125 [Chytriomyces cf. hyalinus JEL632]|nr:hypothetical protein BJ741DRAFT_547580 [Chytriomyces cf. hyalinus JEL632]KAI8843753.1 hypothetical protein BJ741DRAFT_645125 [Chytriomyces cf. hyalinus JEL632]